LEFYHFRRINSFTRKLKIPLLSVLFFLVLGPHHGVTQQTEEEKRLRDLFIKSRQKMEIVPSPTPSAKPTPSAAPSPLKQSSRSPATEPAPSRATQPSPIPRPSAVQDDEEEEIQPTASPQPQPNKSQAESTPAPQREVSSPTPKKKRHWFLFGKQDEDSIVVQKSGAEAEKDMVPAPGTGGVRWKYLTPAVRKAIDDARVARNRWKYVIVHNSGTRQGNARIFDYYHRYVRRMPNGLAYHFVIGNGTSSGNGQVEIGNRWTRQLNGGLTPHGSRSPAAIGSAPCT